MLFLAIGAVLLGTTVALPTVFADSPPRRVAVLHNQSPAFGEKQTQALRDRFKQLGHVEGRDIVFEFRFADGRPDAVPGLASELAALKPSVLIVAGTVAVRAARAAAPDVPIVALHGNMSAAGFAKEYRRPGSGITGVSFLASSLDAKRLQLLAELLPKGSAVLNLTDSRSETGAAESLDAAGRSLGLVLRTIDVSTPADIDTAFATARQVNVRGVNVLTSSFLNAHRGQIIELAAASKLPSIFQWPESAEEGGLIGYGPRLTMIYAQLAEFASRIVRGASPGEIPIEQPSKFELVINLTTAKKLGITIPQSLLLRADKVIE